MRDHCKLIREYAHVEADDARWGKAREHKEATTHTDTLTVRPACSYSYIPVTHKLCSAEESEVASSKSLPHSVVNNVRT